MFAKRIIPCLDCKNGRVVKGIHFENLRDAGDPGEMAEVYNREGADELVMLDISASREGRDTLMETVRRVAKHLFIPLTVGGGVRVLEDAHRLLSAGADKVGVNTAAVENPEVVRTIAENYGRQAIIVAIDARRVRGRGTAVPAVRMGETPMNRGELPVPQWEVYTYGGTKPTGLDALEWARRVEELGAGEILLTSMDADGTQAGFDCELTATIASALHIPVIASGGAGSPEHIAEVFKKGCADAALAASIFHYETHTIGSLKQFLREQGVPVRI
jgi:imidazole glycerol-phosphate synthase subunit HisF